MKNDSGSKDILDVLTDEASLQIMDLLDKGNVSARVISSILNIPISSTYKKIKRLALNFILPVLQKVGPHFVYINKGAIQMHHLDQIVCPVKQIFQPFSTLQVSF